MTLIDLLVLHEGLKKKPYRCSAGKLTIGVGRNLDDVGLTEDECMYLLMNDIKRVREQASKNFKWFDSLDTVRQDVVLSMIFNMGLGRFTEFKKTIAFIAEGKYPEASKEMLNSAWAKQVGQRSLALSRMMFSGSYPVGGTGK